MHIMLKYYTDIMQIFIVFHVGGGGVVCVLGAEGQRFTAKGIWCVMKLG